MRIGKAITPFNTLGHIGGVHWVSLYIARQLYQCDVPVDVGLISGAAACHDIGNMAAARTRNDACRTCTITTPVFAVIAMVWRQ